MTSPMSMCSPARRNRASTVTPRPSIRTILRASRRSTSTPSWNERERDCRSAAKETCHRTSDVSIGGTVGVDGGGGRVAALPLGPRGIILDQPGAIGTYLLLLLLPPVGLDTGDTTMTERPYIY